MADIFLSDNDPSNVEATIHAVAAGDFTQIANRFERAGFEVSLPERGVLQVMLNGDAERPRILLSAGVHGDETGPIEMLARMLAGLADEPNRLNVHLLVVIGNPDAIACRKRYLDSDLNRFFRDESVHGTAREGQRAQSLMRVAAGFLSAPASSRIHLDLHAAIRASLYPSFAIVPDVIADAQKHALIGWLGGASIGAAVINGKPAGTFSAYTAEKCDATSATVELGQVGRLGENDPAQYATAQAALEELVRSGALSKGAGEFPAVFDVVREIVKESEDFTMELDRSTRNFTPLRPEQEIARDGDSTYRAKENECILFPNPDVAVGRRAALIVARRP